jgi:hypothetical protein
VIAAAWFALGALVAAVPLALALVRLRLALVEAERRNRAWQEESRHAYAMAAREYFDRNDPRLERGK